MQRIYKLLRERVLVQDNSRFKELLLVPNIFYSVVLLGTLVISIRHISFLYERIGTPAIIKLAALSLLFLLSIFITFFANRSWNLSLFLTLTLTFVLGQIVLKPDSIDFPAGITRSPAPYMMFTGQPNAEDHNALGYRGSLPPEIKENEYRVIMIGGSTVYGYGPIDKTLPVYLERFAHAQGNAEMQVYNWGVVSQHSSMEVTSILHRAVDYEPDLIILYNGGNDILEPSIWDPRPGYPFNFVVYENMIDMLQSNNMTTLTALALSNIHIIRALFQIELETSIAPLTDLREEVGYGTEEWEAEIVDVYLNNMERACKLAKGFDYRLVVFLQPVRAVAEPPRTKREEYIVRQYEAVRSGIVQLSELYDAEVCAFYDVSTICDTTACEFNDAIHVDFDTRAMIAEELYRLLLAHDLVPTNR